MSNFYLTVNVMERIMSTSIILLDQNLNANDVERRSRTDPGTAFESGKFEEFCREYYINHIICPVKDHRGNGKVDKNIKREVENAKECGIRKEKQWSIENLNCIMIRDSKRWEVSI